ncbi:heavy-metal-associated domain-containing protein [Gynuella sunshinyii]|uniref:Copper chaperone n=1 Tax=Gynuella sunshinyii YC6258 TaxID=1445510 RepID=A0A0C5VPY7_9GAMM|nr:heavy metal-associated domain-containing protein [Gynuella sunshinyii]AJQ92329.1 copper chaperone [Gynuella sunshinyii YC6258]
MSNVIEMKIEGAGCQNCVDAIEKALNGVAGVAAASFDLAKGIATVEGDADTEQLKAAIEDAGYEVV